MRSHKKIIADAGGPHQVARLIQQGVEADEVTLQKRVRAWDVSDSIPGEYWALLSDKGVATLDELAQAAGVRKGIAIAANAEAVVP